MASESRAATPSRAEVRARLEQAAARLFAEQGYATTTIDEIVDEAGVSKPALYRHFESKKQLHLALLERHRDELAAAALAMVDAGGGPGADPDAQVVAIVDAWFAHVEQHPYTWRMLFRDTTGEPDAQALHLELQRRQRAADVALLNRFAPGLPEAEVEPLAEVIRASLTGLALWWLDHPGTPRRALVDAMVRVCRGIVGSAPPAP